MKNNLTLSRFTPSMLNLQTLEYIFVQRERLSGRLVKLFNSKNPKGSKHHVLLIGPRGIGKTHMVSLVYHRLRQFDDLDRRLLVAWLREEEWGVTSYLDLLLRILRSLKEEYSDVELESQIVALLQLSPQNAELKAEELLCAKTKGKSLFLIVENLDEIFRGLEKKGQEKLRAFIQNNPLISILATTQSLFNGISLRTSPFYGFFEVNYLQELTFDEAVSMLSKIAKLDGDEDLATLLKTPRGRARIRAVHHLAGGNPRLYVVFSQFLSRQTLEQLVEPLMQMLDDLTPYYQARMSHLSLQQRKIVEYLCERRFAVSVGEIAKNNFLTHQTTSSQLKKLRDMGYVRSHQIGRESFYEIREPLMRLALELKKLRGGPIRLFVEFLKLWYSHAELVKQLSALESNQQTENEYLLQAIQAKQDSKEDPSIEACLKDFRAYMDDEDYEHALQTIEELNELRENGWDWIEKSICLQELNRIDEACDAAERAASIDLNDVNLLLESADMLRRLGADEKALKKYDEVIKIDDKIATAWNNRGVSLNELGRENEANKSFEKALELEPVKAWQWVNYGITQNNLNLYEEALLSFEKAISLNPKSESWVRHGKTLEKLERYEEALISYENALKLKPSDVGILITKIRTLNRLKQLEREVEECDKALDLEPDNASLWEIRAITLYYLGYLDKALESIDKIVTINPNDSHTLCNRAIALNSLGRHEEALLSMEKSIEIDSEIYFQRNSNYAEILIAVGRINEGIKMLNDTLTCIRHSEEEDLDDDVTIVHNLLIRTRDEAIWRRQIKLWIELFGNHSLLPMLGKGIVRSIEVLSIPWISHDNAKAWARIWLEEGGNIAELEVPLRLLETAAHYCENQDERILLGLPLEERQLLEPLVKCLETSCKSKTN